MVTAATKRLRASAARRDADAPHRAGSETSSQRLVARLGASLAALSCLAASASDAPSRLVLRADCQPTFWIDGRPSARGAGVLVYGSGYPRRTYLLTAQHLFPVPANDMPARVRAARCDSAGSGRSYRSGPALFVQGAHPMGPLATLKDVAVFPVEGGSPGLHLADADVTPGAQVWLMARVKSGREIALLLHRAVVGRSEGYLVYRFDDQDVGLDQTSGGAVLNSAGDVVGLNVGYGRSSRGELLGVADRLATLREALPFGR